MLTTISLGYISRNGEIWTDTANYKVPRDLGHRYNEDLAQRWGGQLRKPPSGAWSVQLSGHAPRIDQLSTKLEPWAGAIEQHLDRIKSFLEERIVAISIVFSAQAFAAEKKLELFGITVGQPLAVSQCQDVDATPPGQSIPVHNLDSDGPICLFRPFGFSAFDPPGGTAYEMRDCVLA